MQPARLVYSRVYIWVAHYQLLRSFGDDDDFCLKYLLQEQFLAYFAKYCGVSEDVEVASFLGTKSSLEADTGLLLSDFPGLVSLLSALEDLNTWRC